MTWDDGIYYIAERLSDGVNVKVLDRTFGSYKEAIDAIDELDPHNQLGLYAISEEALQRAGGLPPRKARR